MKKIIKYIRSLIVSFWLLFANKKEENEAPSLMPLNLQFFADGGDGGSGSGDGSGDGKKFNQDDVNKIVQDRLSRAEKKAQMDLAKSLGFETIEEMQEALGKKGDPKDPPKKDEPIDVDELVDAKLKEQLKVEQEKTFKRLVNAEVKVVANELGFADWEDALALADLSDVKEDDKGNIVGVKEALEKLKEKKPHLLKQLANNNQFGANIPNNQQKKKETLENIKKMAQSRGVTQTTAHNPWA
ncbi:MAG TPA: scaffolding protein [Bacillus bacterium]|nr:scaffolding protein [Bacillus sp. (in: firmicutes)]